METITIDADAPAHPFPHFWERMFGSGRANLTLRQSWRDDLRATKRATGIEYVRFHGIFDDENGIYTEDAAGKPVYNWSYADQIYDGLKDIGVRPFVELSFMPRAMAASRKPHAFWYRPLPNPPSDYAEWGALVGAFARHLVERYGIDEVARWYFEVWNEPNIDFWTGQPKQETYLRLYGAAARALKQVSPRLRVGGPATAQAAWTGEFLDACVKENLPVDFVSTHVYGNDTAQDVFGTQETIARREMLGRAVEMVEKKVRASMLPRTPIIWSEINASYKNEVEVTDSPYIGPWMAQTIRQCDGRTEMMSYWTFSDVFEEQGVVKTPFYGGYGLIAAGGIRKAAFNDFALLHRLGGERIANGSSSALVTRKRDGGLAIALWNYAAPEEKGEARSFRIDVTGVGPATREVWMSVVDAGHGSPLGAWRRMGSPAFPSRVQLEELRAAGRMAAAEKRLWKPGTAIEVRLEPKALELIEIPGR